MSKFMPDALNNNIPGMSMATGLVDKAEGGLNDNVPGMSHVTGGLDQVMDKTKEGVGQVPGANMVQDNMNKGCLLYTSPSPRDQRGSRMPSSA